MRKYFIVAMAVAAVTALTASAAFAVSPNVSTIDGHVLPDNQGATLTKGSLFVETTTLHASGGAGTPTNPLKEPVPTTNVHLDFDNDIVFAPSTVVPCTDPLAGTTQAGMKACGNSYIGGGYATICIAGSGPGTACNVGGYAAPPTFTSGSGIVNATVSAYQGPANGLGQKTVLLQGYSDHSPSGPLTSVLTGTIKNSPAGGDFAGGKRLSVPVPLLASGAAAITQLAANINNAAYIRSTCTGDLDFDYSAVFSYASGTPDTVTDSQPCT